MRRYGGFDRFQYRQQTIAAMALRLVRMVFIRMANCAYDVARSTSDRFTLYLEVPPCRRLHPAYSSDTAIP